MKDYFWTSFSIILTLLPCFVFPYPDTIKLGGIFQKDNDLHCPAFAYGVEELNPKNSPNYIPQYVSQCSTSSSVDAFEAARRTCDLVLGGDAGSVAVFSSLEEPGLAQVRSICASKRIPHVMARMELESVEKSRRSFSVNLFPAPRDMGMAVVATVNHYKWHNMIILYQEDRGLYQIQDILQMSSMKRGPSTSLRKIPRNEHDIPFLLKEIRNEFKMTNIVVDADLVTSRRLLTQAAKMNMTKEIYQYIFINLDMYILDLMEFKLHGCNITGIRIVDIDSDKTREIRSNVRNLPEGKKSFFLPFVGIKTEVAVIVDAVTMIQNVVDQMPNLKPPSVSCDTYDFWEQGAEFKEKLLNLPPQRGATGTFSIDEYGRRKDYNLTIVELSAFGFTELGKWSPLNPKILNITKQHEETEAPGLENKTLRVTVILEEPFVMLKEGHERLEGNNKYEGYCIDLLRQIADKEKFNYTIWEVKDKAYGAKEVNGKWNGMVGELVRGDVDLAVASLTISYSRSEVIDFTVPYMHLGISILFKKPVKTDPSLFTFLSPLSLDVWIYMLAAYLGVSLMLWMLARFSPYEWYNPHPCDPDSDVVENQFNLLNSLWFTVGSLMQQGSDIAPRAASTRLVAGIWWLFTLVLISSYTANLAAFLTVERMVSPIESAEDLAKQTKIKYGSLNRGSTMTFFKESKIQTYERMWAFMESAVPSVFVNSSQQGIDKVDEGDYAYLMESSMLEYYVERNCDLMQIGGLLDSKGYGIGLAKNSPYRDKISSSILYLQEKTVLTSLKDTWWKKKRGGGKCKGEDGGGGQHNELGLQNVGGVFVLLLGGIVLSFIIGIIEFIYKASKNAEMDKRSIWAEMWQELQLSMSCSGSTRPARRKQSIIGYVDDGKGTLVPSFTYGGYTAVPTKSDSYMYTST